MPKKTLIRISIAFGLSAFIAGTAFAQGRTAPTEREAAPSIELQGGEGSGDAIQERAYDPRGNEARQPERSEGNEDDLDLNDGDDGTGGGGEAQGGG